jgi:hypothetical protein
MWLDRGMFGTWCLAVVAVHTASAQAVEAHGIAGNRDFPGTLTFDDPAVADELDLGCSALQHPAEDGVLVTDQTARGRNAGPSSRKERRWPRKIVS